MRECDLIKAVERAVSLYLFSLLINRVGKRLIAPGLAALLVFAGIAKASGILEILGCAIELGIAIWSCYDAVKTTNRVIERFFGRRGMWQDFKNLPRHILRALPGDTRRTLNCLNDRPACCALFQREVENVLVEWVKELKPGWKKGGRGFVKWGEIRTDIVNKITNPLRACCGQKMED